MEKKNFVRFSSLNEFIWKFSMYKNETERRAGEDEKLIQVPFFHLNINNDWIISEFVCLFQHV